jgi:pre-mRNA-processing factor SLU7
LKEKEDEDAIREGEEEAEEKEKEKDEDDPDAKKLKSVAELDEDIYAEDATAPGQSVDMDSRTRITVRNLRIREDTAKYLYSLDPNGPYYDPKSRSMRENPFKVCHPPSTHPYYYSLDPNCFENYCVTAELS